MKKGKIARYLLLCLTLTNLYSTEKISAYSSPTNSTAQILDHKSTPVHVEYTIKEDKIEYKDKYGTVRGIVSFCYPQFTGNSAFLTKLNKQLKKKSDKFLHSENARIIKDDTEHAIENNRFYDKHTQYYYKTSCDVSCDQNGILSFHMIKEWYAGGVHNQSDYGLNYDLNNDKKLTIKDVISGNSKKAILRAAKKYCGSDATAYNIIKETKTYDFYLQDGKVYICFGSYALGHGTSIDIFTVKGNY